MNDDHLLNDDVILNKSINISNNSSNSNENSLNDTTLPSTDDDDLDDYCCNNNSTTTTTNNNNKENNKQIECEQEAKWLEEVGLSEIAQNFKNGEVIEDEILSRHTATLTKRQASAVFKRVNTLNDTTRRKRSQPHAHIHSTNLSNNNSNNNAFNNNNNDTTDSKLAPSPTTTKTLTPQEQLFDPNNDGKIILVSYKGLDSSSSSQGSFDELRLKEVKQDKVDGFEDFKTYELDCKSKVGLTNINDISTTDVENMRNLALLNLTALFDEHNINFIRKKSKSKKSKDSGQVIGMSLNSLLENDRKRGLKYRVPYIFKRIIESLKANGLKTEGILRVPGSSVRIKAMMNELSSSYVCDQTWNKLSVNDVADLLKLILRELPQPLLTNEFYQTFTQILYIKDIHDKLYGFMNLILLLPTVYRDTLKLILEFLYEIIENYEFNKMNLTSVAVIMAPNFCVTASKKYSVVNDTEKNINNQMIDVIKYLIKYHKLIWIIPNDMIKQLRRQNEFKSKKSKPVFTRIMQTIRSTTTTNLIVKRRDNDNNNNNISSYNYNEYFEMSCGVRIDNLSLCAGEIVENWLKDNSSKYNNLKINLDMNMNDDSITPKDGFYLFEQDGNITSRRIDHNVVLKDVRDENTSCNWSVRYWSFYHCNNK